MEVRQVKTCRTYYNGSLFFPWHDVLWTYFFGRVICLSGKKINMMTTDITLRIF